MFRRTEVIYIHNGMSILGSYIQSLVVQMWRTKEFSVLFNPRQSSLPCPLLGSVDDERGN